ARPPSWRRTAELTPHTPSPGVRGRAGAERSAPALRRPRDGRPGATVRPARRHNGRVITVDTPALAAALRALPDTPRVVASGNHSVPWELVRVLDEHVERYVLNTLNGPPGLPDRDGVVAETSFVGPGQRRHPGLRYVPSRLSLVPVLYRRSLPVDAVFLHCSP